jgi:hypothetical protein
MELQVMNLFFINSELVIDKSTVDSTSRVKLEREYEFMEIISTFLRAIRAGAIHPSHGAILLAHYGRLGPTFDLCCKVIVDVLREEGLLNNNGDLVVTAIVQSLQEVGGATIMYRCLFSLTFHHYSRLSWYLTVSFTMQRTRSPCPNSWSRVLYFAGLNFPSSDVSTVNSLSEFTHSC